MNTFRLSIDDKRIFGLDILRAVAILCVLFSHGNYLLPPRFHVIDYDGVSLFFVLSGFLIGGILLKDLEKGITKNTLIEFWRRRWYRTLPNYLLVLTMVALPRLFLVKDLSFADISKYYIFSQNLFSSHPENFFPEAWSLSVEEWFYLLIPVMAVVLIKGCRVSPKTSMLVVFLGLVITVTVVRFMAFKALSFNGSPDIKSWDLIFRKRVITRLDSLMFGVLGAYFNYYQNETWKRYKIIFFIVGLLVIITMPWWSLWLPEKVYPIYFYVFSFTIISVATVMLLPFLSNVKRGRGPAHKIITTLSLISYSAYLLNFTPVQALILPRIKWGYLGNENLIIVLRYICYWVLTLGISFILYKFFELPVMKVRDKKLFPFDKRNDDDV